MPIYELKCVQCGTEFEFFKLKSDETAECPTCKAKGEKAFEKLPPQQTGFELKGKGWYKDGY